MSVLRFPGDGASEFADQLLGTRVDLTAIDASEPRPWLPGAEHILRPGIRATWFAPRGAGKSLAALMLAVQVIEAGGSALYIDAENGERRMAERLDAILADRPPLLRDVVAARLDYRPRPRLRRLDAAARGEWAEAAAGYALAIFDPTARMLSQLDYDENAPGDFTAFVEAVIDPLAERGVAVLLLDNVGHDAQGRPRGTSSKLDLTELAYRVTSDGIGPDRCGTIRLERTRTRDGDEAASLEVKAGGEEYGRIGPSKAQRRTDLHDAVLDTLDGDEPLGIRKIAAAVRARYPGVRFATDALADALHKWATDPASGIVSGARGGYRLARTGGRGTAPVPDGDGTPPVRLD